jgi:hypothetical protein
VVTAADRTVLSERAMIEARSAAPLDHPGIVAVYDVVEEDDRPWIVMRLVEGRSLDQVVYANGPLDVAATARLGLALVDALRAVTADGQWATVLAAAQTYGPEAAEGIQRLLTTIRWRWYRPAYRSLYRSEMRFGYAACEYSLISPSRIFLRRIRVAARSTTPTGVVSVALGGR